MMPCHHIVGIDSRTQRQRHSVGVGKIYAARRSALPCIAVDNILVQRSRRDHRVS